MESEHGSDVEELDIMGEVDLCFYKQRPYLMRIYVGSDVHIVLFESGEIGMEHICPGIWREEGIIEEFRVCPLWGGVIVSENPLTLSPSLLCLGAAKPCGRHGFVENGVWRDV